MAGEVGAWEAVRENCSYGARMGDGDDERKREDKHGTGSGVSGVEKS